MSKHTKEPWSLSSAQHAAGVITGGPERELHTGAQVQGQIASACLQEWMATGEREANARRIVACVNACEGMSNDELEGGILLGVMENRIATLEQQRDKLLSVLDGVLAIVGDSGGVAGYRLNGDIEDWG